MILFKKDSKGKIRRIKISVEGNKVIQQSGLLDGKLTTNIRECKPKNTGRANATTPEEQALSEALSIVDKKLKEGYFKTIEEAHGTEVLMPMLAKSADVSKLVYPFFVQPKLDGMRATSQNGKLISRKNREIDTMKHIEYHLHYTDNFDGELYAHGLSFQENMKLIKKLTDDSWQVGYHVYDIHGLDEPFSRRYMKLKELTKFKMNVNIVPAYEVNSYEELIKYHTTFLKEGYEGTIIRLDKGGYEYNKRSDSLLKFKDFIDEAYEIIDVVPSEKIPTHGVVVCKMDNGSIFKCGMKVSHEVREYMLEFRNEFIGQTAEVRYFELTDDGIPRFPVFFGVRLDK